MTPAHLIEHARQSGVVLALNDDRLTWSAPEPPTPDLLALLRDNKPAVIEHLRQQQRAWLERVAALLNTTGNDLLARGLIDTDDMAEQHRTDPRHAAKLIASCPDWQAMVQVRGQFREHYARVRACARARVRACARVGAYLGANQFKADRSARVKVSPRQIQRLPTAMQAGRFCTFCTGH